MINQENAIRGVLKQQLVQLIVDPESGPYKTI